MPNPYDPESEHRYKWYFNTRRGEWEGTPKEKKRISLKSFLNSHLEFRATPNGIEIKKRGVGENWTKASDIVKSKDK